MKSGLPGVWRRELFGKGSDGGTILPSLSWIGFVLLILRADTGRGGAPLGMLMPAGWMTARDDDVSPALDEEHGELHAPMTGEPTGEPPLGEAVREESFDEGAGDAEGDLESSRFHNCPRIPAGDRDTDFAYAFSGAFSLESSHDRARWTGDSSIISRGPRVDWGDETVGPYEVLYPE